MPATPSTLTSAPSTPTSAATSSARSAHALPSSPRASAALRFAEVLGAGGQRLHVGCVMAAGTDWVEVSMPDHLALAEDLLLRFPPSLHRYAVVASWRGIDRVGFTYPAAAPAEDDVLTSSGLRDPRPAALMLRR